MENNSTSLSNTDIQTSLLVVAPRHLHQLAEYLRRHNRGELNQEKVVEWALDDFFERNFQCDSQRTILTTLRQYKYL